MRFGPSGNGPHFAEEGHTSSIEAPKWLHDKGLTAYEYSFGRGYTMSFTKAKELGEEGVKNNIQISIHAPYFINLANTDEEKIAKSFEYVLKGFDFLRAMKGNHLVIHTASQMKLTREEALSNTKKNLEKLVKLIYEKGFDDMFLCLETMGKYSQIGSYEEIIELCKIDKILIPTFDFGHINCTLQGALKTEDDFRKIFDFAIKELGFEKIKNCHVHFSKIEFNAKGEIKHLDNSNTEFGPNFAPFAKVVKEYNLSPICICESKTCMVEDALEFKNIYENV